MTGAAVAGASMADLAAFLLAQPLQRDWPAQLQGGCPGARAGNGRAAWGTGGVPIELPGDTARPGQQPCRRRHGLSLHRFMAASIPGEAMRVAVHLGTGHLAGRAFRGAEVEALKPPAVAAALGLCLWIWRHRHGKSI